MREVTGVNSAVRRWCDALALLTSLDLQADVVSYASALHVLRDQWQRMAKDENLS